MASQVTEMAHLRPLQVETCRTCGARATEELFTGLNDKVASYCRRHAQAALARFKRGAGLV